MKTIRLTLLCLLIILLPGCKMLSEQQRVAGAEAVQQAYDRGELTTAQRDASLKALEGGAVDWATLLTTGGSILASVLLGVPIAVNRVQQLRGPVATTAERAARITAAG